MTCWKLSIFPIALLLASCATHAPLSYRLTREASTLILTPPGSLAKGPTKASIAKARQSAPGKLNCDIQQGLLTLHWKGRTAQLTLTPPASYANEEGRPFAEIERQLLAFSDALRDKGRQGCQTPEEGSRILHTIAERFPLPAYLLASLQQGAYASTGFLELTPDFALEVISPLNGSYESARYTLLPIGDGLRFQLASVNGGPAKQSVSQQWLTFPDSTRYFRLLFRISRSAADHDTIILGARTRDILQSATETLQNRPEQGCGGNPDYGCAFVPAQAAANPQIRVLVNGHEEFATIGARLREITDKAGRRGQIPPGLRLMRTFRQHPTPVEFDPASNDVLDFTLMAGDQITW